MDTLAQGMTDKVMWNTNYCAISLLTTYRQTYMPEQQTQNVTVPKLISTDSHSEGPAHNLRHWTMLINWNVSESHSLVSKPLRKRKEDREYNEGNDTTAHTQKRQRVMEIGDGQGLKEEVLNTNQRAGDDIMETFSINMGQQKEGKRDRMRKSKTMM